MPTSPGQDGGRRTSPSNRLAALRVADYEGVDEAVASGKRVRRGDRHRGAMILAGDIGGTKTNVAVFAANSSRLRRLGMETYPSREYQSLGEIIEKFLGAQRQRISSACFGIAGPVKAGRVRTTNLPWVVDAKELATLLGLRQVGLVNDIEATAWGIAALGPTDVVVINAGNADPEGNAAVIAAGTGLGEAGMAWTEKGHWPFASEGGHSDFSPRNELEIELLRYLSPKFGRVSYERVLSGPGLHNIYGFFREVRGAEEPPWLTKELAEGDPAAVISRVALEGRAAICEQSLDVFVEIFGAEAGNLALKMMATAGVYLGGGIAPKIAARLERPDFVEAFVSKGRLRPVLEQVPVRLIVNELVALIGAARWALHHRTMSRRVGRTRAKRRR